MTADGGNRSRRQDITATHRELGDDEDPAPVGREAGSAEGRAAP
ncbi:MAG: hypothetical protein ACR2FU_21835 [Streptosporangiaceae bacterium]